QETRENAHDWFSLVEDLNRSAVATLARLAASSSSDRELAAAALFGRAVQSFEAAIILAERGMLADAGTIARNIVECAIYLAGLAQLEDFPQRLAADNNAHYAAMARALAELGDEVMSKEDATDLLALVSGAKE